MTSISEKANPRKPRRFELAAITALGAIALLAGSALLLDEPQPALAASEQMASAITFRILSPQTIDRLASVTVVAKANDEATASAHSPSLFDDTSCVMARAARKTDRHDALDPKAFCQLQHRLLNAELIGRMASLERDSQSRLFDASSQPTINREF